MAADSLLSGLSNAMHGSSDQSQFANSQQPWQQSQQSLLQQASIHNLNQAQNPEILKRIKANQILKEFVENMKDDE